MINIFETDNQKENFISTHTNPFKMDKCKRISFTIENSWYTNNETSYNAFINFQNGDTDGSHKIKADDFPSLVKKVDDFMQSL